MSTETARTKIEGALTPDELVFAQRMLPHFMAGKSAEDAARNVLSDDARLFTAFCDQAYSYFINKGDGTSGTTREGAGDVITKQMCAETFRRLRLSPAQPTPRRRQITGRSALRGQPEQTTNPQREY